MVIQLLIDVWLYAQVLLIFLLILLPKHVWLDVQMAITARSTLEDAYLNAHSSL
jgi:hypothetical protein